jgi:hypothetical protein
MDPCSRASDASLHAVSGKVFLSTKALFTFSVFEKIGGDYPPLQKIPDRLFTKMDLEGIVPKNSLHTCALLPRLKTPHHINVLLGKGI